MSQKNVRSTKPTTSPSNPTVMTNATPPPGPHIRTNLVTIRCIDVTGKIVTDQRGHFPVTLSRGNKYIMVAYAQDPNMILAEPIKSRSASELLHGYNTIYVNLLNSGFKSLFQITDNECPASFQAFPRAQQNRPSTRPFVRPPHKPC